MQNCHRCPETSHDRLSSDPTRRAEPHPDLVRLSTMRPVLMLASLLLVGCGAPDVLVEGDPPPTPYDGPMQVEQHEDDPDVMRRSGAAALA